MKTYQQQMEEDQLKKACILLERRCRQLGKDCQVIFMNKGVSIAPTSWAGDSTGETLYDALMDAERSMQ